jgi:glycosyltransferase involved in cell wall biosynthesis
LTVFCNDRLDEEWAGELAELAKPANGRLAILRDVSLAGQVVAAAAHDLLLWPSLQESFGWPAVLAATAGVPCVAYDQPVVAEIVKDDRNGVLIGCDLTFSEAGAPTVVSDSPRFFGDVMDLLLDAAAGDNKLGGMRSVVLALREDRAAAFASTMSSLFVVPLA